ncbi:hypothetical protein [Coleofasciculus sp. G3-WIS-01]|uniref:hypothetical protein n=1 Tax=Coleofasciculus sp. G3-WIS-01 TaxID=3069528 RepID=UPI00406476BE
MEDCDRTSQQFGNFSYFVSIPDRDSGEFQGETIRKKQQTAVVSIPDRDSGEFQDRKIMPIPMDVMFQSLIGIQGNSKGGHLEA